MLARQITRIMQNPDIESIHQPGLSSRASFFLWLHPHITPENRSSLPGMDDLERNCSQYVQRDHVAGIRSKDRLPERLTNKPIHTEHMEAYGVAEDKYRRLWNDGCPLGQTIRRTFGRRCVASAYGRPGDELTRKVLEGFDDSTAHAEKPGE